MKDLGVTVCQLKSVNVILRSQYEILGDSIDEINQYQRKYNIEIHNISEQEDETLENLVVDLAKELDWKMGTIAIDIVHRLLRRQLLLNSMLIRISMEFNNTSMY